MAEQTAAAEGPPPSVAPGQGHYPNCVQLPWHVDVERMLLELGAFADRTGRSFSAASGRRVLPLRSVGGDPYRSDSGGPGMSGYSDTPWLRHLPYFQEILDRLPGPVRAARLWAASPGGKEVPLRSAKLGPPWGLCRLHLPVVAKPRSYTLFPGERHYWAPGGLWFVAAWRDYLLVNRSESELVHLIVDLCHTARTSELFPEAVRDLTVPPQALLYRRMDPTPQLAAVRCSFLLPDSFMNWEQPAYLFHAALNRPNRVRRSALVPAEIKETAGRPVLHLGDRPVAVLEHLGDHEFRLRGWSDERTLQVTGRPEAPALLRLRQGSLTYRIELPPVTEDES
ncbi:hypothetical protein [Streptomyces sp. NPDC005209]|uniref:hypothetical protein n=1 Tax=Streptomyces sp. NPDC005209 TaxID=3156715 RepID=UPI0033B0505B